MSNVNIGGIIRIIELLNYISFGFYPILNNVSPNIFMSPK
jgi:hypothetical protein